MERITILDQNIPDIGLYTRLATKGEEYNLMWDFIDFYCSEFARKNKEDNLAVFVEPRLSSGFPDMVFVTYSQSIQDNWSFQRKEIVTEDLKMLAYLIQRRKAEGIKIRIELGLSEKRTQQSLEKLREAKLIAYTEGVWQPQSLKTIFSIKELVSIEAKIGSMSRVLEQSMINTWFASHSYALTVAKKPRPNTLDAFSKRGVGLYTKVDGFKKLMEAKSLPLPSSYQSLQFNEWIGNKMALLGAY